MPAKGAEVVFSASFLYGLAIPANLRTASKLQPTIIGVGIAIGIVDRDRLFSSIQDIKSREPIPIAIPIAIAIPTIVMAGSCRAE